MTRFKTYFICFLMLCMSSLSFALAPLSRSTAEELKNPNYQSIDGKHYLTPYPITMNTIMTVLNTLYYNLRGNLAFNRVKQGSFVTAASFENTTSIATAIDFKRHLDHLKETGELPQKLIVHEWGVGNGQYAAHFLNWFQENEPEYYERITYVLADFSEKMLKVSASNPEMKPHFNKLKFIKFDGSRRFPKDFEVIGKPLLVRSNELYDDLPGTRFFHQNKDGEILETKGRLYIEEASSFKLKKGGSIDTVTFLNEFWHNQEKLQELDESFLQNIKWDMEEKAAKSLPTKYRRFIREYYPDLDIPIPINFGALRNLKNALDFVDPRGILLISDYGFVDSNSLKIMTKDSMFRRFGGQLTSDVNFLALVEYLISQNVPHDLRRQGDYIGKQVGKLHITKSDLATYLKDNKETGSAQELMVMAKIKEYFDLNRKNIFLSMDQVISMMEEDDLPNSGILSKEERWAQEVQALFAQIVLKRRREKSYGLWMLKIGPRGESLPKPSPNKTLHSS